MISKSSLLRISFWITVLGWGWGWVGIRADLHYFTPGQLSLGRYCISSLVLLPFFIWKVNKIPRNSDLPLLFLMGLLGFTFNNLCTSIGSQTITAGEVAMLASFLPILTALGAALFFKEHVSTIGWIGIMIAFFGISLMNLKNYHEIQLSPGALITFVGVVCASAYSLLIKNTLKRYSPIEVTCWTMWFGTLGFIPFGRGVFPALAHAPLHALVTMCFLGAVTGGLCYATFVFLTAHVPMAKVASVKFFIPITSVLLGWFLLGELPSWIILIGGAITIVGAYLVYRYPSHKNSIA